MQYRVICVSNSGFVLTATAFSKRALERLTKEVNEAIAQGWEPQGGITIYGTQMLQAMIKRR
ncbi:MAG: hypothetical protein ABSG50_03365 [Opitutaceae bacterium]|jgi:hypothetical protein